MKVKKIKESEIGVLVERPTRIVTACQQVINEVLNQRKLGFSEKPITGKEGNRSLFTLIGQQATNAKEKYDYKVIPFVVLNSRIYWLTVSLEFLLEQKQYRLISVSIFFFEGDALDNRKIALLRAEWGCLPSDINGYHAQPHWHIYPSQISWSAEKRKQFDPDPQILIFTPEVEAGDADVHDFGQETAQSEELEVSSTVRDSWSNSESFHFAMASRWHYGDKTNEVLTEDMIPKWLSGCLQYTIEQFQYIYQK